MILKIYKPSLLIIALLASPWRGFAQDTTASPVKTETTENYGKGSGKTLKLMGLNINMGHMDMAMNHLNKSLNDGLASLDRSLQTVTPDLKDIGKDISASFNDSNTADMSNGDVSEKVKTYSKTYPLDANDRLKISNRYGRVEVNTWNKNEVKVDIEIKSYADDDQTAQKMIDAITISDSKNGDQVSFKTNFGSGSSNSVWDLFNNRNDHHKAEVNYTIYMPAKNALDIENHYGAIELPDFDGKVSIQSSYGNFEGKSLMHADNQFNVRYGSVSIGGMSSGDISVNYGNLELGSADNLNGAFRYSSIKIGKIKSSVNINAHYAGVVDIDNLDKNFSSFSYSSNYSNLKVGISDASNANFDVTVRYGSFDYGGVPVEITEKTPSDDSKGWKPTKNFKGHIGKGSTEKTINISSTYGGVKFE